MSLATERTLAAWRAKVAPATPWTVPNRLITVWFATPAASATSLTGTSSHPWEKRPTDASVMR